MWSTCGTNCWPPSKQCSPSVERTASGTSTVRITCPFAIVMIQGIRAVVCGCNAVLLLGTVVIGLLFATKCCYRARRRSRWLKRLVFTLCILLCGCLTFFEWRTAGVGTEWVAGIMAMPYKVYDFAMESFVLTVVVMALFGFVSLLSWAQSCRSRR